MDREEWEEGEALRESRSWCRSLRTAGETRWANPPVGAVREAEAADGPWKGKGRGTIGVEGAVEPREEAECTTDPGYENGGMLPEGRDTKVVEGESGSSEALAVDSGGVEVSDPSARAAVQASGKSGTCSRDHRARQRAPHW